jgi:hypothetical protein
MCSVGSTCSRQRAHSVRPHRADNDRFSKARRPRRAIDARVSPLGTMNGKLSFIGPLIRRSTGSPSIRPSTGSPPKFAIGSPLGLSGTNGRQDAPAKQVDRIRFPRRGAEDSLAAGQAAKHVCAYPSRYRAINSRETGLVCRSPTLVRSFPGSYRRFLRLRVSSGARPGPLRPVARRCGY